MRDGVLRVRADGLVWREIDGELVVLDVDGSVYLGGNATASALWCALVEGASRDVLTTLLVDRFDVDAGTARADVDGFLEELEARGLLAP